MIADAALSNIQPIYYMCPSCEDDRPQISDTQYFDEWDELDRPFPDHLDTLSCEQLVAFHVNAHDALEWDWYGQNGMWGMWSQRAKDLLWPYAKKHLRCFQTTLNGAPYYILRVDEELAIDCLDRERSELQFFESSGRVMQVKKYVFRSGHIIDPLIFHVPEKKDILGTHSIRQMVLDAGLKGFHFEDVEHLNR